jgi:hypothetical protein
LGVVANVVVVLVCRGRTGCWRGSSGRSSHWHRRRRLGRPTLPIQQRIPTFRAKPQPWNDVKLLASRTLQRARGLRHLGPAFHAELHALRVRAALRAELRHSLCARRKMMNRKKKIVRSPHNGRRAALPEEGIHVQEEGLFAIALHEASENGHGPNRAYPQTGRSTTR